MTRLLFYLPLYRGEKLQFAIAVPRVKASCCPLRPRRCGLFTGGMERLSAMPLFLALYLQLKGWHKGDRPVLADITLIQCCLAFLLLFAYVMSWNIIQLRTRVQSYEQLLAEANRQMPMF